MSQNADKPAEESLAAAERALQLQDEKRIRDAQIAAADRPAPAPTSHGPGTESERIARLKASHGSHRTAGSALPDHGPGDEAVRRKAFELWETGGRRDGHDQEDWFRAKAMIEAGAAPSGPTAQDAPSAMMAAVADSVQNMTMLAAGAAEAIAGMFTPPDRSKDRKKS